MHHCALWPMILEPWSGHTVWDKQSRNIPWDQVMGIPPPTDSSDGITKCNYSCSHSSHEGTVTSGGVHQRLTQYNTQTLKYPWGQRTSYKIGLTSIGIPFWYAIGARKNEISARVGTSINSKASLGLYKFRLIRILDNTLKVRAMTNLRFCLPPNYNEFEHSYKWDVEFDRRCHVLNTSLK